jgi:hypothetical protein
MTKIRARFLVDAPTDAKDNARRLQRTVSDPKYFIESNTCIMLANLDSSVDCIDRHRCWLKDPMDWPVFSRAAMEMTTILMIWMMMTTTPTITTTTTITIIIIIIIIIVVVVVMMI